jgi:hypothetical protein
MGFYLNWRRALQPPGVNKIVVVAFRREFGKEGKLTCERWKTICISMWMME